MHKIIGIYADGHQIKKEVSCENLATELQYDIDHRPGRALFLDGYCIHKGYLSAIRIDNYEKQFNKV